MSQTRRSEVRLHRDVREARRARHHVAAVCAGLGEDLVATAQLLTSELVTNALSHGAGDVTLCVTREPSEVYVEVTDSGDGAPRAKAPTDDGTGGRGLLVVDALSSRWGVTPEPRAGTTVWFRLCTA